MPVPRRLVFGEVAELYDRHRPADPAAACAGESFPLLYAAQAWHWIDPAVRFERARAALPTGGLLAAFWNRPAWPASELRTALLGVYESPCCTSPARCDPAGRAGGQSASRCRAER